MYLSKADLPQLPELLELVRPPLGGRRVRSRVALVDGHSIATRLGHLLDRALFETVLRNRLREATANERTVAGPFSRASAIVSRRRAARERIREAIEGERVSFGEGRALSVTASVGMVAARGPDARQLVLRAFRRRARR